MIETTSMAGGQDITDSNRPKKYEWSDAQTVV